MNGPSHSRQRQRPVLAPNDYKRQRRGRRMERTAHSESEIRAWTEQRGCSLRVLNGGHHWLFQKPGFMAEWWPSSARLAVNRDYLHDHAAPHWAGVMAVLQQHLFSETASKPSGKAVRAPA